ncbi:MAG: hypothetical protein HYX29_09960 [Solirubrobacterales bacterium]|nr:hypothetical protein [Solirubrobacterales bacterium]
MPAHSLVVALLVAVAITLAGCGGGEAQNSNAQSGSWSVTVEEWKFPKRQFLGTPTDFVLKIRNTDTTAIPQLIVTIEGLRMRVKQIGAASEVRPIWLTSEVDYAQTTPYNSALSSSFNLGPLAAGAVKTYKLDVTPLRRGTHEVGYKLAGDLFGKAEILDGNDAPAADTRMIAIDPTPQFDKKFFNEN